MNNNDKFLWRRTLVLCTLLSIAACDGATSNTKGASTDENEPQGAALEKKEVVAPVDSPMSTENTVSPELENAVGSPEILPIYVNADGVGILRYSRPDGSARELWLAAGGMTDNPERPFETIASDAGPFAGPHIAIYLPGGKMHLPLDQIAYSLYERDPYKHFAYLRPVIDPAKAETMEACGEISRNYECSKKKP